MRDKRVWIMNHYASRMFFDKGGRHYYFTKYLGDYGYRPVVFCCNAKRETTGATFVPAEGRSTCLIDEETGVPWVFVKSSFYKGNGVARVRNMLGFAVNLVREAEKYAEAYGRPDIILASSVHPLTLIAGIRLAKRFGIKCICEVRDLWPMSIFEFMPALSKHRFLVKALYRGERWIYEKADALIFTFAGGRDYIVDQKWDKDNGGKIDLRKVFYINNGVDLDTFQYNLAHYQISDSDLEDTTSIKLIYTGAIRTANDIDRLIEIAKEVHVPNVKWLIYGAGDKVEALKKRIQDEHLEHIRYKGFVKKQEVPYILSKASFTVMHWRTTGVSKYGESLNKSFEYYAAGKPVIYTVQPGHPLAKQYDSGFIPSGEAVETVAREIADFIQLPKDRYELLSAHAQETARDFDFKLHTERLHRIIDSLG